MKLMPNIDISAFLQAVQDCKGDVYFVTQEEDVLNLKSVLSQFVFTAVVAGNLQNLQGFVKVKDPQDAIPLREYISD